MFLGKYFTQKKKKNGKLNIDLNLFIISIFIIIVVFWYKIDEFIFCHTNPQLSVKSYLTIFIKLYINYIFQISNVV